MLEESSFFGHIAAMIKLAKAVGLLAGVLLLSAFSRSGVEFPAAALGDFDLTEKPKVSGLLARPEGKGPFPAVVLLHSCGGMNSHVRDDWPAFLTTLGYATLSVDTFGSRGYDRCPNAMSRDTTAFVHDAYGALAFLAKQPDIDGKRVAVMGFSLGAMAINGQLVSWRGDNPGKTDFKAAVAFYGRCGDYHGRYTKELVPLMEIVGTEDSFALGCKNWGEAQKDVEVHVLAGVYHAFDSPEADGHTDEFGHFMRYDAAAVEKARNLTKAFLAKHLGK
jgi:dienelactone hydrolase